MSVVPKKIAVCILFYERVEQTIACVNSFLPSQLPMYILNNGSSKNSTDELQKYCAMYPQITWLSVAENIGVARGRNHLIDKSTEDWLLFVDSDITIETADWVERICAYLNDDPTIEVLLPRLYNVNEKKYSKRMDLLVENGIVRLVYDKAQAVKNKFSGGAAVVNRKVFGRLGKYDEKMFIGFEDVELCLRGVLSHKPITCVAIDNVTLYHRHAVAVNATDRQAAIVRYSVDVHKNSFDRMCSKHAIAFDLDWKDWLVYQEGLTLHKRQQMIAVFLRQVFKKIAQCWKRA